MSFALTDEQLMIQTMAREFSRDVVATYRCGARRGPVNFPLKT